MNLYEKNCSVLKLTFPKIAEALNFTSPTSRDVSLQRAADGSYTCKITSSSGEGVFLHSKYSPMKEARRQIELHNFNASKVWILLGLGLGYQLFELLKRIGEEDIVIVIEGKISLFLHSLHIFDWTGVLRRKNFALFVGEEPGRLIECIKSEFRAEIERKGVELVECKGSVNLSPQYYSLLKVQDFILEALPDVSESIRSSEKYPKFKTSELRILTFKVHTSIIRYMLEDCADSLLRLGHKVRAVEMPRFGTLSQSFIRELGEEITKFKPDFVFTIDHIGIIPGLFSSLKLPYASWFVDHPFFWVTQEHLSESVSPYSVIFLWDRACIPELREFGFKKVFFLPLATNPRIFKKLSLTEEERKRYECNVSFVGSSTFDLSGVWNSYLREELRSPKIKSIIEEVIERQSENPLLSSREILMERLREHKCSLGRLLERESFEKILEFAAMAKYRKEIIEEVADFGLHLYGDRDWLRLLDKKVKFLGTINYLENLPKLYNASKINLSITMAQMKTTVNQRVYDVSACGAFVLSDYRRDLEELFEIDREVVFYKGKHDLREKVLYFLEHKAEREELSRRAQARVLRDHTYDVRMQRLTKIMQETFG